MQVRKWTAVALCLALILALAGCGASTMNKSVEMASPMMAAGKNTVAEETVAADAAVSYEEGGSQTQLPDSRKWIITVDMAAETEDMDTLLASVTQQVQILGGYIQEQRISNGSQYASYRYRNAYLTVRIPAEQVDAFTQSVSGVSNVVRISKSLEDITLQYVDTESRLKALQTEESRLLELMAQAQNMSDLLQIEGRLTEVRYELESVASRLRTYDNLVNYATIYLSIEEVKEFTPVEEETFFQRITGGFVKSVKGVGKLIVNVLVWLIVNLPYIVVLGAVAFGLVLLGKKLPRKPRKKAKKEKDAPKPEEKEE